MSDDRQNWLAQLTEGDEVYIVLPTSVQTPDHRLVTVSKVTNKFIFANGSKFNRETGERVGRKERYYRAPYLVEATEELKHKFNIKNLRASLTCSLTHARYEAMPLEILLQLSQIVDAWCKSVQEIGVTNRLYERNPRG